jgi:hypothetical protein
MKTIQRNWLPVLLWCMVAAILYLLIEKVK